MSIMSAPPLTSVENPSAAVSAQRTLLPWQAPAAASPSLTQSSAADRWAAAVASIPYLAQTHFSSPGTVYQPPSVLQLSEAAGCSVSDLAGAYNDLPVIRLSKEVTRGSSAMLTASATQTFNAFDYLQPMTIDDTLELATNARRARRPVPDAEETFWEEDYWTRLRRIKEEQQQRKEQQRRQQRSAAEGRRAVLGGAPFTGTGLPTAHAVPRSGSPGTSPSLMTPYSRQASLSGHAAEADVSPLMTNVPSAQRQKRIAKGLLRRARYNESQNAAYPVVRTTRSTSIQSVNSTSGGGCGGGGGGVVQQSVVRCRTRPRSYSITSQQTDVRGFQYSISSAMSESNRSVLSDSLRTPPQLSISNNQPSRELLVTSVDNLDSSASVGPLRSGATTQSRSSALGPDRVKLPPPSPLLFAAPSATRADAQGRRGDGAAATPDTLAASGQSTRSSSTPLRSGRAGPSGAGTQPGGSPTAALATPPAAPLQKSSAAPAAAASSTPSSVPSHHPVPRLLAVPPLSSFPPPPPLVTVQARTKASQDQQQSATVADPVRPASLPLSPITVLPPPSPAAAAAAARAASSGRAGRVAVVTKAGPYAHGGSARVSQAGKVPPAAAAAVPAAVATKEPCEAQQHPPPAAQAVDEEEVATNSAPPALDAPRPSPPPATPAAVSSREPLAAPSSTEAPGQAVSVVAPATAATTPPAVTDNTELTARDAQRPVPDVAPKSSDPRPTASPDPRHPSGGPSPSPTTQEPVQQEPSLTKSSTTTRTSTESATPRATATTVPPSRTPTREASASPRFERLVAVHAAAPSATPSAAAAALLPPSPKRAEPPTPAQASGSGAMVSGSAPEGKPAAAAPGSSHQAAAKCPAVEAPSPRASAAQQPAPAVRHADVKGGGHGAIAASSKPAAPHTPSRPLPASAKRDGPAPDSAPPADAVSPRAAKPAAAATRQDDPAKDAPKKKSSAACCAVM